MRRTAGFAARLQTGAPAAATLGAPALGTTNLQETIPLIYVLTILSVIGAGITWAVLAWALYKFRDPATRGRKYG